jgi:carbonic anhydrase
MQFGNEPRRSSRAGFFATAGLSALGIVASMQQESHAATPHGAHPSAEEVLAQLMAGNRRYASDSAVNCMKNYDRRAEVAGGQNPYAIVLACSDSRVAPETIFDQRIGDLFVVRVAGNIADSAGMGSMEYAIDHFHSPLLLVMGHSKCGAVSATLSVIESNGKAPGHIATLVDAIEPAARSVIGKPGDALDNAIRANVAHVVATLKRESSIIEKAVATGALQVVGAHYSLSDGTVHILG